MNVTKFHYSDENNDSESEQGLSWLIRDHFLTLNSSKCKGVFFFPGGRNLLFLPYVFKGYVLSRLLRISVWELLCHLACRGLHVLLWSIVRLGKCLVCCIIDSTLTWIVASSWSSMSVWSGLSWNQVQLCPPFGLGCGAAWTLSEVCFTYMLEGLACWLF